MEVQKLLISGNEPAYPFEGKQMSNLSSEDFIGLTIRQQFAMSAMNGIIANNGFFLEHNSVAHQSVLYADALIAELNRTEP